jgi:hypothetical protein
MRAIIIITSMEELNPIGRQVQEGTNLNLIE